ncbi:Vitamin B12 ABC transporter, permease component BtuC [Bacillus thermotolerans]|uniref:Vitamin B12 ABC transporter, permease component BtuC n=2 Tax=Bacillus thermotolerans TaxID=1221996 RepID=A0A0F5HUB9_BACTR|nr:Vitamin B12 ABC transporter, permease component BtuC [Bacillus thermotolerans]
MDKQLAVEKENITVRKKVSLYAAAVLLLAVLAVSMTLSIMIGPVPIHPVTVWEIALFKTFPLEAFITPDWSVAEENIVWNLRFPRVLLAIIAGAGLAVIGTAIQALVRNSLADPYILGVSSGASVGATLVILFGAFSIFGPYALVAAAFLGSLLSMILVFFLAQVGGKISTVRLLLAGIAVSMILSAVTSFIVISAPQEEGIKTAMFWMMGSLSGAKWTFIPIPAAVTLIGFLFLWSQYRSLNILLMGEEAAVTLGIRLEHFRKLLIVVTALLTGVLVSVCGSIGFVGLMVPHIVRLVMGSDHRTVLPISALVGAIFLVWADICARTVISPEEMPIGIVTALCGGPFFLWLLRRSAYSFGGER